MTGFHKALFLTTTLVLLSYFTIVRAQVPTPAGDPRLGTWKLNLEKSQFTAGSGPEEPKMQVRRVQSRPDGFIVFTQIGIDRQDNPIFIQATYKLDGKNYPEFTQTSLAEFAAADIKPNTNAYKLSDADCRDHKIRWDRESNGNKHASFKQRRQNTRSDW